MSDTTTQAARHVMQYAPDEARQAPCWIGPTGSGKTARATALASALGLRLEVLLPGTALPEDILGLPQVADGRTHWTLPDWAARACEQPTLILIDELDKARAETHGALLTLLSAHELRGQRLHPQSRIVCAMQPVDRAEWLATETGRALSARLVYLPITYDRARTAGAWGCTADDLAVAAGEEPAPVAPTLPVISDRQLTALAAMLSTLDLDKPDGASVAQAIAAGIAGERAPALLDLWRTRQSRAPISGENLARALIEDPALIESAQVPELVAVAGHVLVHGTPAVFRQVLEAIGKRGCADDWRAMAESLHPTVAAAAESADTVTIFRGSSASEADDIEALVKELGDMTAALNKHASKRKGKK